MNKLHDNPATTEMSRRSVLGRAAAGTALGAVALAMPGLAKAQGDGPESEQLAEIHQLQAAFHFAKCTQDIDLMMSLWAADSVLVFHGVSYVGTDAIRALFLTTGSFTHLRLSLVPSFKFTINLQGNTAYIYFECVDIGTYDTAPFVASVLFNAGLVKKVGGKWLFWQMNGGPASPLSVDHYYYP